jgi:putative transposase
LDVKKRFSEEQIIGFLREAEAGVSVKDLCRRHGFSEASYYLWRSKFGGMSVPGPGDSRNSRRRTRG